VARKNIIPILVTIPGFFGMNTRQIVQSDLHWAGVANNCVIDASGRLAARRGRAVVTSAAVESSNPIQTVFEQVDSNGALTVISAVANELYSGTTTLSNITGVSDATKTFTANHWDWGVLSDQLVGAQDTHDMVVRTTGNFTRLQAAIGDHADSTAYVLGDIVKARSAANPTLYFQCTTAGTSAA